MTNTKSTKAGDPASLVRDLTVATADECFWYYAGCFGDLPVGCVLVGGVTFCRFTEDVYPRQPGAASVRDRRPGMVQPVTREKLERLKRDLPNRIVRFTKSLTDRRVGQVVRIMTDEENETRQRNRFRPVLHVAQKNDRPLSDFLWLCPAPGGLRPFEDKLPGPLSDSLGERAAKGSPAPTGIIPIESDWEPMEDGALTPAQTAIRDHGAREPLDALTGLTYERADEDLG